MEKNKLQEYCQQNKLPFPKYQTKRVGGVDHNPLFQSKLTLSTGEIILSAYTNGKKKAELDAAAKALENLKLDETSTHSFDVKKKVFVIIDGESLPQMTKFANTVEKHDNLHFVTFIGHSIQHQIKEANHSVRVVPSSQRDAVDHMISVAIGILIGAKEGDYYFVATRDHFGAALQDCIEQVTHIFSVEDFQKKIQKYV